MAEKKSANTAKREQESSRIWLYYYNRSLYEKGIITERERNRMDLKIDKWQMPQQML